MRCKRNTIIIKLVQIRGDGGSLRGILALSLQLSPSHYTIKIFLLASTSQAHEQMLKIIFHAYYFVVLRIILLLVITNNFSIALQIFLREGLGNFQ